MTYHESCMKPSDSKSPQSTQNGSRAGSQVDHSRFPEMMGNSFTSLGASLWWPLRYIIFLSGGAIVSIIPAFLFWITGSWWWPQLIQVTEIVNKQSINWLAGGGGGGTPTEWVAVYKLKACFQQLRLNQKISKIIPRYFRIAFMENTILVKSRKKKILIIPIRKI